MVRAFLGNPCKQLKHGLQRQRATPLRGSLARGRQGTSWELLGNSWKALRARPRPRNGPNVVRTSVETIKNPSNIASQIYPDVPKTAQDDRKTAQDGPTYPKTCPRRPKTRPSNPERAKVAQDTPKMPPRYPQDGLKMPTRWPQDGLKMTLKMGSVLESILEGARKAKTLKNTRKTLLFPFRKNPPMDADRSSIPPPSPPQTPPLFR